MFRAPCELKKLISTLIGKLLGLITSSQLSELLKVFAGAVILTLLGLLDKSGNAKSIKPFVCIPYLIS